MDILRFLMEEHPFLSTFWLFMIMSGFSITINRGKRR